MLSCSSADFHSDYVVESMLTRFGKTLCFSSIFVQLYLHYLEFQYAEVGLVVSDQSFGGHLVTQSSAPEVM